MYIPAAQIRVDVLAQVFEALKFKMAFYLIQPILAVELGGVLLIKVAFGDTPRVDTFFLELFDVSADLVRLGAGQKVLDDFEWSSVVDCHS